MLFRHQGSTQIQNQEDDFQLSFAARQLWARTMDKRYEDIHDKSASGSQILRGHDIEFA